MDLKSSKGEYVFDDKFNPPKIISETEKKITPQEAEKQKKNHIGIFREYE